MAVCQIVQFSGIDKTKYDAVIKHLDFAKNGQPKGALSHIAGPTPDGWCVVDVWESQADFDAFFNGRLKQAFAAVGGFPQPRIMAFPVQSRPPG
jgi:hypothetical protein